VHIAWVKCSLLASLFYRKGVLTEMFKLLKKMSWLIRADFAVPIIYVCHDNGTPNFKFLIINIAHIRKLQMYHYPSRVCLIVPWFLLKNYIIPSVVWS